MNGEDEPASKHGPVRVETAYCEDPRNEEIAKLKGEITRANNDATHYRERWETACNEFAEEREMLRNRPKKLGKVMAKFFTWFLFVPAWFTIGLSMMVLSLRNLYAAPANNTLLNIAFACVGFVLLWVLLTFLQEKETE